MRYRNLFLAAISLIFPLVYGGVSILGAWIDIYLLNHWDPKFGQDMSFRLSITLIKILTGIASIGYIGGFLAVLWKTRIESGLLRIGIITFTSAILSSAGLWGLFWLGERWGVQNLLFIYLFFGPASWSWLLLWITHKISVREVPLIEAV